MNILEAKIIGFQQTVKQFITSKTNWLALTTITAAGAGFYTKAIGAQEAINTIGAAVGALFIRDAIK